jgi:hypothetical protein
MSLSVAEAYSLWQTRVRAYADLDEDVVVPFLEEALAALPSARWHANDYPYAVIYYAAHNLALEVSGATTGIGAGGPMTSRKAGGVSVAYALPLVDAAGDSGGYGQTQYGRKFLELRRRQIMGRAVAVGI